ncbi:hypothetical protein AVEN_161569-1 [Araneus ventricosus]|uniref:Uncharacterized protein n=1 Tax=Araneus ventricosus TaxID=182803 RepID=A0A4Y2FHG8_ARAVE|nr:hypothetical protein AVEN_161569-1 [Araneus ventricosus]
MQLPTKHKQRRRVRRTSWLLLAFPQLALTVPINLEVHETLSISQPGYRKREGNYPAIFVCSGRAEQEDESDSLDLSGEAIEYSDYKTDF